MRILLQRVKMARVVVEESTAGEIGPGLLVFAGFGKADRERDAEYMLDKILHLRVFEDDSGKMNRNVSEAGGSLLFVSQFTLYADIRRGRRPSFDLAAPPDQARKLYEYLLSIASRTGLTVAAGVFQADMQVTLLNDGPVTIYHDSFDKTATKVESSK